MSLCYVETNSKIKRHALLKFFFSSLDVGNKCENGCDKNTCHNNGVCQELWNDHQFKCNCHENGFSGLRCEKGEELFSLNQTSVTW